MDLRELYQEVIIDHNRSPRNFAVMPNATCSACGHNPLCGDKITLFLQLDDDVIKDASFTGNGCAISTASASLMTEFLKEKTIDTARSMFAAFHAAITQHDEVAEKKLGKLAVLTGVKAFPSRVKCATLAWHTLHSALEKSESCVSTE